MRRLQENRWAKLCAVLVLLAAAFGAGVFGVRALLSSMAVTRDSWQDTSRFYSVLDSRRGELLEGIELLQRLSLLEKQIKEGSITDDILLADVEAFQEQVELVEERFSRLNTWFRFRVLTGDRQNVVGTNLLENEAMVKAVREVHYFHFELEGEKEEAYPSGPEDPGQCQQGEGPQIQKAGEVFVKVGPVFTPEPPHLVKLVRDGAVYLLGHAILQHHPD